MPWTREAVDVPVIFVAEVSHVTCAFKKIHSLVHAGIYGRHKGKVPAPLADGSGLAIMFRGGQELQIIPGRIDFEDQDATLFAGDGRL